MQPFTGMDRGGEGYRCQMVSHTGGCRCSLDRNQRKKKALFETKARYNSLVEENKQLLAERENAANESYEVTEYLRREILSKNERIGELEAQLQQVRLPLGQRL